MAKKDYLFIDCETFGNNPADCAVIDVSVVTANPDIFISKSPYTFEQLVSSARRYKLDVKDQLKNYKYKVDPATAQFWAKQDKTVRAKTMPQEGDLSVSSFVKQFLDDINSDEEIGCWWSRRTAFDPAIIHRLMRTVPGAFEEFEKKLRWWNIRDTVSFIDGKLNFPKKNDFCPLTDTVEWDKQFKKHDSIHDVCADVLRLQTIARVENDLAY